MHVTASLVEGNACFVTFSTDLCKKLFFRVEIGRLRSPAGHSGKFLDFCSLYPSINKYCEYPVGAFTSVTGGAIRVERNADGSAHLPYFGLVYLKVVPMKRLLHPVLPYRTKGNLHSKTMH